MTEKIQRSFLARHTFFTIFSGSGLFSNYWTYTCWRRYERLPKVVCGGARLVIQLKGLEIVMPRIQKFPSQFRLMGQNIPLDHEKLVEPG